MLEKINLIQWGKLTHRTYTFNNASSHQRVQPASKVIVEPRLCFSSCLVHCSLSHVWQSIPEYCKFFSMDCYLYKCRILVPSIYALFWACYTHPPIHWNVYVSMTNVFMVSKQYTTITFISPPFLCMDRWYIQMMDFFDFWYLPNFLSWTYWLINSFCMSL